MDSLQLALDTAAIVLLVTMLLGLVLATWLIWSIFLDRRFKAPRPAPEPLPNPAVEQLRAVQETMQALLPGTSGEDRAELEAELRRLEKWRVYLEDRLERENEGYALALRRLERGWQQWKEAHERVWRLARDVRSEARERLRAIASQYRDLERHLSDERLRAVTRNRDALKELHDKHLLQPPVLARLQAAGTVPSQRAVASEEPTSESRASHSDSPQLEPVEEELLSEPLSASLPEVPEAPELEAGAMDEAELPPLEGPGLGLGATLHSPSAAPEVPEVEAAAPPDQGEQLYAKDFQLPATEKSYKTFAERTLDASALPPGGLARVNLSGSVFLRVEFTGVHRYRSCEFSGADLRKISLTREKEPHRFVHCAMNGVRFTGARIAYTLFYRCDLRDTDWRGTRLDRVKFEGCDLDGADWRGVNLSRTVIDPLPDDRQAFALAMKPPYNLAHAGAGAGTGGAAKAHRG